MKRIIKHIGLILGIGLALIMIALLRLRFYTNHNATAVEVPDLTNVPISDASNTLESLGLEVVVTDTTFKEGARKSAVINQNPVPGQEVKPGRTIYLVINMDKVPMVEVPDLVGKTSLNQAKSILSRSGLVLGKVIEKPCDFVRSLADQPVIGQFSQGDSTDLEPGSMIERNSTVDLMICIPMNLPDSSLMEIEETTELTDME